MVWDNLHLFGNLEGFIKSKVEFFGIHYSIYRQIKSGLIREIVKTPEGFGVCYQRLWRVARGIWTLSGNI